MIFNKKLLSIKDLFTKKKFGFDESTLKNASAYALRNHDPYYSMRGLNNAETTNLLNARDNIVDYISRNPFSEEADLFIEKAPQLTTNGSVTGLKNGYWKGNYNYIQDNPSANAYDYSNGERGLNNIINPNAVKEKIMQGKYTIPTTTVDSMTAYMPDSVPWRKTVNYNRVPIAQSALPEKKSEAWKEFVTRVKNDRNFYNEEGDTYDNLLQQYYNKTLPENKMENMLNIHTTDTLKNLRDFEDFRARAWLKQLKNPMADHQEINMPSNRKDIIGQIHYNQSKSTTDTLQSRTSKYNDRTWKTFLQTNPSQQDIVKWINNRYLSTVPLVGGGVAGTAGLAQILGNGNQNGNQNWQ